MHPKTRRSLGKSGELLSYISIMYVELSASMYTNPELLASERPFSHPPSVRKQHPETFTVAPVNTNIASNLFAREGNVNIMKALHQLGIIRPIVQTGFSFSWLLKLPLARSLAYSHTRMNPVNCVEACGRQLLLLRAFWCYFERCRLDISALLIGAIAAAF
jgi:hypothetical protein